MKILIKAIANAKKNEIIEDGIDLFNNKKFKIKVNQPPEDGRANKAIIELLSEYFNIKKSNIVIISGMTSSNKIIELKIDLC